MKALQRKNYTRNGFTLMELLLVMSILSIMASVLVVVLQPQEYLRRTRDSRRISDIRLLGEGLNVVRATQRNPSFGSSSVVYVSVPDSDPTCANLTLPALPSGWSYACASSSAYRNIDGTGWIPVDFTPSPGVQFSTLPVDERNSASDGYYYTYTASSTDYAVAAMLASSKRLQEEALTDGGTDPARFERGSDLSLWANATGLVGWWALDGNAQDESGNGHHGTNADATATTSCKINSCMEFNGSSANISIGYSGDFNVANHTVMAWVKKRSTHENTRWIFTRTNGLGGNIWRLGYDNANNYQFFINASEGNAVVFTGDPDGDIGNWIHMSGTYDGEDAVMYRNSIALDTDPSTSGDLDTAATGLCIGANGCAGNFLNAVIDDVRFYSRALSTKEIEAIYKAQQ